MKFGEHAEHLEELADEDPDRAPAALDIKPELPAHLHAVREAFWLLNLGRVTSGGGMTQFQVEPLAQADVFGMADVLGFDRLYFLRVIRPADCLYRESLAARTHGN